MKANIKINRIAEGYKQTIGQLVLFIDGIPVWQCMTLEKANLHNQRNVSSIPVGVYKSDKIYRSSNGKQAILLHGTEPRTEILIHSGNYYTHSAGCLLVGDRISDINNDGYYDVGNSNNTMEKLFDFINDDAELTVEIVKLMV